MPKKALVELTNTIANLPMPTSITYSFQKDWGPESTFAFSGDGIMAGLANAGAQAAVTLAGNTAAAGISAATGLTLNKNEKVLFRTLPFRTISFNWMLVPKSSEQAMKYEEFIKDMKVKTAPPNPLGGATWAWPDTFILEIKSKVGKPFVAFRSPELACTDLVVDHTPQGFWTNHTDGYPIATSFTMTFMELQLAFKERLEAETII